MKRQDLPQEPEGVLAQQQHKRDDEQVVEQRAAEHDPARQVGREEHAAAEALEDLVFERAAQQRHEQEQLHGPGNAQRQDHAERFVGDHGERNVKEQSHEDLQ